jgi:hypothetical protein
MPKLADHHRRTLEMLVDAPNGLSESALLGHDVSIEDIVDLGKYGLATAKRERLIIGGMPVEITRLYITKAGRQALTRG